MKYIPECGWRVNYITQQRDCFIRSTYEPIVTEFDICLWRVKWKGGNHE